MPFGAPHRQTHYLASQPVHRLVKEFDTYDHLVAHGSGGYSGGMFEYGPGRGQLQYLASLFHADAPNDVAPAGYNLPSPSRDLPHSPVAPEPHPTGLPLGGLRRAAHHPRAGQRQCCE